MFSLASRTFAQTQRSATSRFFHASTTALAKLNVEDLASKVDLNGENVLMRVDLNVPLSKEVSCTCPENYNCPILSSNEQDKYLNMVS